MGCLNAEPDLVPVDFLSQMVSQSEHIQGLIRQSAAAVILAGAGLEREPLPGVSQVLDNHAVATRQLHEAFEGLTTLIHKVEGEIRERTLLDHRLAAAFEQEEGSRNAALHDQLTGLSNRVLFNDRLEHGIAQATRHGWLLAVMFVDLNEFKSVNDTHGHQAGDAVLKSIAFRLAHTTRHEDTVSRYGGDEFLCLLTPLHEQKHIAMIATKMLAAIQAPCEVCGQDGPVNLWVDGSIGISVFPLFLEQLVETLQTEQTTSARNGDSEPTPAPTAIGRAAALHGAELLRRGFTVDQVVHDYGDVCQCVTALAVEQSVSISSDEFRTLNRCLDNAIADAVSSFGEARNISIERQVQTSQQRLLDYAVDHRRLVAITRQSFTALKTGNIGIGGATGTLLEHTLTELDALTERLQFPAE